MLDKEVIREEFSILFVDDEEKITKYFKKYFEKEFKVYVATDGEDALRILSDKFDEIGVIISDQRMPKITGVELLNKAKNLYPNIIRILVTTYADIKTNIEAINEGRVFGYLRKPWNLDELKKMIQEALMEHRIRNNIIGLSGSIAHDVRNPLFSASLITQSSQMEIQELLLNSNAKKADYEKLLNEILENAELSLSCINRTNNVIDIALSNVENRKISSQSFSHFWAKELMTKAIEQYAYKNKEDRKRVIYDEESGDFFINVDQGIFLYIMFNILNNALHYSNFKSNLTINISHKLANSEFLYNQIIIEDDGSGIDSSIIDDIFDDFVNSKKFKSNWLGLAFCKRSMKAFGGDIVYESEVNRWTRLILSFPVINGKS